MTKRKMYLKMILSSFVRRKSRMLVALLAVIGSTIMSGLITIYFDIPRQLEKSLDLMVLILYVYQIIKKINSDDFNKFKEVVKNKSVVELHLIGMKLQK